MIRSQKVLRSAKGQPCTARFPGICNSDPATTVWAHLNGAAFGKGMGIKAHDVLGFHSCSDCHRYLDVGHGTRPLISDDELLRCILDAVCTTYVRLIRAGIVDVPQDEPKPASARPAKARKPPSERTPIPTRPTEWPKREMRSRNNLRKEPTA